MLAQPFPKECHSIHSNADDLSRGALVRSYRRMRGLSVGELAAQVFVTPGYIRLIESGHRDPRSLDLWLRLARILRIPRSLMFGPAGGDDPPGTGSAGTSVADEDEILRASWDLFYRSGIPTASALVSSAIRRIGEVRERRSDTAWLRLLCQFHQLAGVIARDRGDRVAAMQHATIAEDIARQLDQTDLLATALFRKGRTLAAQDRMAQAVLASREAAILAPRCRVPLRGYLTQNLADMLSRQGMESLHVLERHLDAAQHISQLPDAAHADGNFVTLSASGILHDWALISLRGGADLTTCRQRLEEARRHLADDQVRWHRGLTCTEVLIDATHGERDSAVERAIRILPAVRDRASKLRRLRQAHALLVAQDATDSGVQHLGALLQ